MYCLQLVGSIEEKSEQLVTFRLVVVDTSLAKAKLVEKTQALRFALLEWVRTTWADANQAAVSK